LPFFRHDDINFRYVEMGRGVPFIFQHGLGADVNQTFGLFRPPPGIRMLTFECRGHGRTSGLGNQARIGIPTFVEDLAAFVDHLELPPAVVGGISMGADLALNFVLRFPERSRALVLSRPARLEGPWPRNVEIYSCILRLIREHGPQRAEELFQETQIYREVLRESRDTANMLLQQFKHPRLEEMLVILERMPRDQPRHRLQDLSRIRVPTLVMPNRQDPVHPFEIGETLAATIPGAELRELTPKSVSREQHAADVQRHLENFLRRHVSSDV
jgi:pimeloyl-ACP methyl ester carboxylesterase